MIDFFYVQCIMFVLNIKKSNCSYIIKLHIEWYLNSNLTYRYYRIFQFLLFQFFYWPRHEHGERFFPDKQSFIDRTKSSGLMLPLSATFLDVSPSRHRCTVSLDTLTEVSSDLGLHGQRGLELCASAVPFARFIVLAHGHSTLVVLPSTFLLSQLKRLSSGALRKLSVKIKICFILGAKLIC